MSDSLFEKRAGWKMCRHCCWSRKRAGVVLCVCHVQSQFLREGYPTHCSFNLYRHSGTAWNCTDFFREDGWRCIKSRSIRHFLAFATEILFRSSEWFYARLTVVFSLRLSSLREGYPSIFLLNHFKVSFRQPIYEAKM